jgi:hypothetical protein
MLQQRNCIATMHACAWSLLLRDMHSARHVDGAGRVQGDTYFNHGIRKYFHARRTVHLFPEPASVTPSDE